jgi:hypothetical protein
MEEEIGEALREADGCWETVGSSDSVTVGLPLGLTDGSPLGALLGKALGGAVGLLEGLQF